MALLELFAADRAITTITAGGTDAPASGSAETWTAASSAMFGAAVTGVSQFHVADTAAPSEVVAVTNVTGLTWTVTRGADGTTPVSHAAGFTVYQVAPAGWLGGLAQLASPALTGTPTAPTAPALTGSVQLATTAYADSAVAVETSRAEASEALKAPLASPALTGNPTAPTQSLSDNSTKVATTAYVTGAVAAAGGGTVTSVTAADTSVVVGGTSAAPTVRTATLDVIAADHPPAADWSNSSRKITSLANGSGAQDAAAFGQIPTSLPPSGSAGGDLGSSYPSPTVTSTHLAGPLPLAQGGTGANAASDAALLAALGAAPLASPALTGTPAAPTAPALTDSTQLATTAYADSAVAVETTRAEAAESANASAITAETARAEAAEALKAPLASPALTGSPTAPTQTAGDNSTKIATDAFAATAVAVETTRAETAEALLAPLASPALTGTPTAPTAPALTSSTQLATTAYADGAVAVETSRAEAAEALKLALAGGTMSGPIAMGASKITGLANGSGAQDAAAFGQIPSSSSPLALTQGGTGLSESTDAALLAALGAAPLASPALTGTPVAPTASALASSTQLATTAYADSAVAVETSRAETAEGLKAPLASPALTGNPTAPTQSPGDTSTKIATDAFAVAAVAVETSRAETAEALLAPLASPALTGSPTAPTQAAGDSSTKLATTAFVAAAVTASAAGLSVKPSVQEATAAALPANTYSNGASGVGATLTAVLPGVLTVDGIAVAPGDRVLVQDEAAPANNGIYAVSVLGTVSAAWVLTRATDMNTAAQVPGAFCFCEQGTANAGAGFTVASAGPFTIGTTAVTWTQFSGTGEIAAGTGLGKTGNTLNLSTPVSLLNGGTGVLAAGNAALLTALGAAPLASPALAGTPTAPTAAALADSTQLATTAYADAAVAVETTRAETAEALKAPLASPALTGSPTAPTQTAGDNSTKIATTAYVTTAAGAGGVSQGKVYAFALHTPMP